MTEGEGEIPVSSVEGSEKGSGRGNVRESGQGVVERCEQERRGM